MSRYDNISTSLQIQKTYLSNLNKQLLSQYYQNDAMIATRNDVSEHVKYLTKVLDVYIRDCIFYMLYDLQLTDSTIL